MKKIILLIFAILILILFSGCRLLDFSGYTLDLILGKPKVIQVEPKNNAKEVPLDSVIKIKFNKEMDEKTLNSRSVNISYVNDELKFYVNPFLGSRFDYDQQSKTLTITPKDGLLPNQKVEVRLSNEVKSKDGKELVRSWQGTKLKDIKYVFRFQTAAE